MVASLQAVIPPPPPLKSSLELYADDPGTLLERGLGYFRDNEPDEAVEAFQMAIDTNKLNDAGRVLAYWHIFIAERQVGHIDQSSEALAGFVAIAEDIVAMRSEVRYAVSAAGDFVKRFDLLLKLNHARALLSATWAHRASYFGRSVNRPILVHNAEELGYFLEFAAPCPTLSGRRVQRQKTKDRLGHPIHQITVSCGRGAGVFNFFFDVTR